MFIRGLDKRYNLGLMKAVSRGGTIEISGEWFMLETGSK